MTTINATGTSTSKYPAERATVTARISHADKDRAVSIGAATALHNSIVARAEALRTGGDAESLSAEPISTWARKSYDEGTEQNVIVEHITSSAVNVTLVNLELVSALVEEFAVAGAETSVQWSLSKASRLNRQREARKQAVAEARSVADDYADALGERVTRVVSISDARGGGSIDPQPRFGMMAADASAPAEVTIAEITVSATVQGVFESE